MESFLSAPSDIPPAPRAAKRIASLQDNERTHILQVYESCYWKIKGPGGAARKLDMNPATLYSRTKKLGIRRPSSAIGGRGDFQSRTHQKHLNLILNRQQASQPASHSPRPLRLRLPISSLPT